MSIAFIHPTAVVEEKVTLGSSVKVWHFSHLRSGAILEDGVSLGRDVFIDSNVSVGANSRIQNGVSLYQGVNIKKFVFVGPHVTFTNDLSPRVNKKNWKVIPTVLENGCSIGAGSIIRCGVIIGSFAMIGAGSVVTKSVAPFTMVVGLPAIPKKKICACGDTQYSLDFHMQSPFCEKCEENLDQDMLKLAEIEFEKYQNARTSASTESIV